MCICLFYGGICFYVVVYYGRVVVWVCGLWVRSLELGFLFVEGKEESLGGRLVFRFILLFILL